MINDSGYFYTDEKGTRDTTFDLCLNSAGHYKLVEQPVFETLRPGGRVDFQFLYIAKGAVNFEVNGKMREIGEGNLFFYPKEEPQHYLYRLENRPDVYWLHFTGSQAEERLREMGFTKGGATAIGPQSEFPLLIQKMIRELQVKRPRYHVMANLYLKQLMELLGRCVLEGEKKPWDQKGLMEKAITDFHQLYHSPIQINRYAQGLGITSCWFIRCFKGYTGQTPMEYISEIRLNKAKEMLYSSSFTISEIAQSVGYSDPLYFSRMFKKGVGISPQGYRKKIRDRGGE